ncbi:uncharacterized protein LOC109711313 [Ananas comosus]|uniref:Uncharacterized protein LOC109711313 n=1 Tax=Ananas comosus TaxID=4615 RepID=A0A6P5F2M3_ANACO|nr:uncharacterized protein LOC109711313 [Ananas comosus]
MAGEEALKPKVGDSLLSSMAVSLLSSIAAAASSKLPLQHQSLLRLLRRALLLLLHALLTLLFLLLPPVNPKPPAPIPRASPAAARALSHVLAVVARVPVASRKYEAVRSLAERLLDDNLRFSCVGGGGAVLGELNRAALSDAFARTLRRLDAAAAAAAAAGGDGGVEMVVGAVKSRLRRWWWSAAAMEGEEEYEAVGRPAEKLAAEMLWLGQKMSECGAAGEAVALWGAASALARRSLAVEPRLQAALLRVSVFLFKHANSKQFEEGKQGEEEKERIIADGRLAMLMSWLPLLCQASNGTDSPVLSSREKEEMVRVLEELIEKLSWEQQEEVLALWLHHFASFPDSDWPNLEASYTRWYAEARKLLLKYSP